MTRYLNLYGLFLTQRFKILMEYRVNFLIGASSTIFVQVSSLLTIWVVMRQVPSLNGWSYPEVLLIYGLVTLAKSINHMFADNLWTIGRQYIRTGSFDRFLVRPINPLFHLLADRFCHDGIGNFLVGLVLVLTAARQLAIPWTPANIGFVALIVLSGGLIFIALNMITGTSAFWLLDAVPVMRVVFDFHLFAQYPLSIYPKAVGILLTWLIPYGFASFYPASYLTGRALGGLAWLAPLVALVLLLVSYRVWKFGLRHYAGTGS
jgi:ABC-2 type transport system permease protein